MITNIILIEYIIVGILAIYSYWVIFNTQILVLFSNYSNLGLIDVVFVGSLAYVIGFIINVLAEAFSDGYRKRLERIYSSEYLSILGKKDVIIFMDRARYLLFASDNSSIINRLEYHNSLLRISRCICLESFIFIMLVAGLTLYGWKMDDYQKVWFLVLLGLFVLSGFAFHRRIRWLTKTTIMSLEALNEDSNWCYKERK